MSTITFPVQKRLALYHIGLIILLSCLNYLNALSGPFLWDDRPLILENAFLRTPQPLYTAFTTDYWSFASTRKTSGYYRPLLLLSYRLDTFFWGFRPFGFHLTNLLLHTLNAVLVYWLACHLLPSARSAWLAALFFAAHPIHTESVSWISGRTDLIVTLFLLAAFLSFLSLQRGQGRGKGLFLSLLLFCFALALLAKENALVFPLLLLGYRWFFPSQEKRYTLGYAVGGSVTLIILYLGLRFALVGSPVLAASNVPFTIRLLTAPKLFVIYLKLLLLPVGLHIQRDILLTPLSHLFTLEALLYLLLTLLVLLAACVLRKRFPLAVFAFFWIGVTLLPVLNLLPLRQVLAERFLYLPSVGFSLLLAFLLFYPLEKGLVKPAVALGCALLILG
ncbi:MAG: phospholipid carrier-dependent glycosyltransferase, partial [Nitrospinota bacterium]